VASLRGPARVEHHAQDGAVGGLLLVGEGRRVRAQGADGVDDELGLAIAARAQDRQVDDRGHAGVGVGQAAQAPQLGHRLAFEQRRAHRTPGAGRRRLG
jgi:hypothetical protein